VIRQERAPGLRWWPSVTMHVCRDRGLAHHDSDFPELTVDPGRTPERIRVRHRTNQRPDVGRGARPTGAPSALPPPEQAKPAAVPCHDRRGLHEDERCPPAGPRAREPHPEPAVSRGQTHARRRDRLRTWSWCLSARTSRCSAARERISERSDRSTATKAGIIDRRLCDVAENMNDPDVRHFW
jgi:hypothetical protein